MINVSINIPNMRGCHDFLSYVETYDDGLLVATQINDDELLRINQDTPVLCILVLCRWEYI